MATGKIHWYVDGTTLKLSGATNMPTAWGAGYKNTWTQSTTDYEDLTGSWRDKNAYSPAITQEELDALLAEITTVTFASSVTPRSCYKWFEDFNLDSCTIGNAESTGIVSGGTYLKNTSRMFYNAFKGSGKTLTINIGSDAKDGSEMFANNPGLETVSVPTTGSWTSYTDISYMFANCPNLKTVNLVKPEFSAVTNVEKMFYNCTSLETINMSSATFAALPDASHMFAELESLISINLASATFAACTNMSFMFAEDRGLETLTLTKFNTTKVTDMSFMFDSCFALKTISLGTNFKISVLEKADYMFGFCVNLSSLTTTAANWTTTNATLISAEGMFEQCVNLSNFSFLKNIKTTNLKNARYMLSNVGIESGAAKTSIDLTGWNLTNLGYDGLDDEGEPIINYSWCEMFYSFDIYGVETPTPLEVDVKNMVLGPYSDHLFYNACIPLSDDPDEPSCLAGITSFLNMDTVNSSALTSLDYMFNKCSYNGCEIDLTTWDLSNVRRASGAFGSNYGTTTIKLNSQTFSNLTVAPDMFAWFQGDSIDLTGVDFSKVRNFDGAFSGVDLNKVIFDNVKTSNSLQFVDYMFGRSKNLSRDVLKYFNFEGIIYARYMFEEAEILGDRFSFWGINMPNLKFIDGMFKNTSLKYIDIFSFSDLPIESFEELFSGCTELETIYTGAKFVNWSSIECDDVFKNCTKLVGGSGTVYNPSITDSSYARCDLVVGNGGRTTDQKGYFSAALTMDDCLAI